MSGFTAPERGRATLLAAAGVPPLVVMEILGHSQIAVTKNVYTHVAQEHAP
ncbi:tyrosine-type recombinase/integrase [Streptomyces sp. NPDC087897]|uniref:tyrosine-type recombinase/integrase n=1 Tax=Streptomyces sp. NPDC087897 TaxID=3365817 RepID=UPI003816E41E